MEELLGALVELLLTMLLELAGEAFADFLSRSAADAFDADEPRYRAATWFACIFLGSLVGGVSVAVLPHPVFRLSRFHGISLIVSPIATGLVMSAVGRFLRQRGKQVMQIETFPYAFAFALGMALVRLLFTS